MNFGLVNAGDVIKKAVTHKHNGYWVLQAVPMLTLSRTAVKAGLKDSRL